MRMEKSKTTGDWAQAHRQAQQMGIVLTRRKNAKGEYVCYLSKKSQSVLPAAL